MFDAYGKLMAVYRVSSRLLTDEMCIVRQSTGKNDHVCKCLLVGGQPELGKPTLDNIYEF